MGASAFLKSVDFRAFAVNVKTIARGKYLYQSGHAILCGRSVAQLMGSLLTDRSTIAFSLCALPLGLHGRKEIDFPYKIENDIPFLYLLSVHLFRRMDDDFLDKFVDDCFHSLQNIPSRKTIPVCTLLWGGVCLPLVPASAQKQRPLQSLHGY